ncbi:MAG: hypothetical protein KGJ43_05660 [Acidobacteriota bacterium]|nr:hypothetical protein [Acidobacteriota bacterium]
MGFVLTVAGGLALWVVLWSLSGAVNLTSFDSFLIAMAVILTGAMGKLLGRYLPGRRR